MKKNLLILSVLFLSACSTIDDNSNLDKKIEKNIFVEIVRDDELIGKYSVLNNNICKNGGATVDGMVKKSCKEYQNIEIINLQSKTNMDCVIVIKEKESNEIYLQEHKNVKANDIIKRRIKLKKESNTEVICD